MGLRGWFYVIENRLILIKCINRTLCFWLTHLQFCRSSHYVVSVKLLVASCWSETSHISMLIVTLNSQLTHTANWHFHTLPSFCCRWFLRGLGGAAEPHSVSCSQQKQRGLIGCPQELSRDPPDSNTCERLGQSRWCVCCYGRPPGAHWPPLSIWSWQTPGAFRFASREAHAIQRCWAASPSPRGGVCLRRFGSVVVGVEHMVSNWNRQHKAA